MVPNTTVSTASTARHTGRIAPTLAAIGVACALALIAAAPAGATNPSANLSKLQKYLNSLPKTTYQATYVVKNSSNGTQTMVVAQAPPKSYFKTASGAVISTGKKTYYCSTSSGKSTCFAEAGAGAGASLTQLLNPAVIGSEISAYANEYASHIPGVSISSSSKTIAGLPSTCVTAKAHGQTATWCVSNKGVLTSVTTTGSSITLKSFSTSVPSSLFNVPAGSVQTIPTYPGGSIPGVPTT